MQHLPSFAPRLSPNGFLVSASIVVDDSCPSSFPFSLHLCFSSILPAAATSPLSALEEFWQFMGFHPNRRGIHGPALGLHSAEYRAGATSSAYAGGCTIFLLCVLICLKVLFESEMGGELARDNFEVCETSAIPSIYVPSLPPTDCETFVGK